MLWLQPIIRPVIEESPVFMIPPFIEDSDNNIRNTNNTRIRAAVQNIRRKHNGPDKPSNGIPKS